MRMDAISSPDSSNILKEMFASVPVTSWGGEVDIILFLSYIVPSRRDDIVSLCYFLIYLKYGGLPWMEVQRLNDDSNFF